MIVRHNWRSRREISRRLVRVFRMPDIVGGSFVAAVRDVRKPALGRVPQDRGGRAATTMRRPTPPWFALEQLCFGAHPRKVEFRSPGQESDPTQSNPTQD